ncbi:MAG: hypothetical protein ACK5W9_09870 [Bdellovibrionales bacterium]
MEFIVKGTMFIFITGKDSQVGSDEFSLKLTSKRRESDGFGV